MPGRVWTHYIPLDKETMNPVTREPMTWSEIPRDEQGRPTDEYIWATLERKP